MTLFYLCFSWLAGIALAPSIGLPFFSSLLAAVLLFLFAFTVRRFRIPFLCAAFFLFGSARLSAAQPKPGPSFIGSHINASGEFDVVLDEDPLPRGSGYRARAHVKRMVLEAASEFEDLEGAVLVEYRASPQEGGLRYGDRVRLSGLLKPPPEIEGFDYAGYLARQGVYGILKDPVFLSVTSEPADPVRSALFAFRRRALEVLRALFPEPEGALLAGILLGEESAIPLPLQEAFSRTGTTHIIAISGFNISIIAGIFLSFTKRLPRRFPGWLPAVIGIGLYTVLVGAAASVVRAAIMGGMAVFARHAGRRSHGLTSLGFAAAAMTLFSPWTLWDIGFQLSFAATLGLILYADPLQDGFERLLVRRISKENARLAASVAGELFLMTTAAQITTLPVLLLYFNNLSISAFLVNPLILSVQPMVMLAGGLALLLGMLWLPAGRALAWAGWAPTAYTIRVVEWGGGFSRLWWPLRSVSPVWIGAYFAVLVSVTVDAVRKRFPRPEWGRDAAAKVFAAAPPILAAAVFLAWGAYFRGPDGRLHLTMLSAGDGEALLLRTPEGGTVLIGAGGDPNLVVSGLGSLLGFGPQRLDWIVVGATSWESTTALFEVAARFEIGGVLLPAGTDRNGTTLAAFLARCREVEIPLYEASAGSRLSLGEDSSLTVLMQSGAGLILSVERRRARWLIFDGLDESAGRFLLSQGRLPSAQIVVFPLSVKETGGLPEWLRAARPLAGLWPYAEDLGWPEGVELLRADAHGWVDISTDGERMWVRVER
jgi:competence protein ComEC